MILDALQNNNPKDKFEAQESALRLKLSDKMSEDFAKLISGGDILEKTILSREDFLLVLGGIKPATDFELPKNIIAQYDLGDFKLRLESVGLKMADVSHPDGMFHAYIYNPKLLVLRSQKLEALIPFSEVDDLNVWIEKNIDASVSIDMVLGSLLGFPQSSIDAYIAYKKQTKDLHHAERFGGLHEKRLAQNILKIVREENRHFVESYGESYLIGAQPAEDVATHEKIKKEFFQKLEQNNDFYGLWKKTKGEVDKNEDKLSWEAHDDNK